MRMITPICSTMVFLWAQLSAMAVTIPVLIKLESNATDHLVTYVVPDGKTLAIDAIQFNGGDVVLVMTNGTTLNMNYVFVATGDTSKWIGRVGLYSLNRSIKVPSGVLMRVAIADSGKTNSACVYGSEIDAADLYANLKPLIRGIDPLLEDGQFLLAAQVGRETIARVEQSPDVSGDQWDTASTFATGLGTERTVKIDADNEQKRFYRLRTLTR